MKTPAGTTKATIHDYEVAIETDATPEAVRAVWKSLEQLGFDLKKVVIRSVACFVSRGEHVFATELRLLGVRPKPEFLKVELDGQVDHARPSSARVVIVCGR